MDKIHKKFFIISLFLVGLFSVGAWYIKGYNLTLQTQYNSTPSFLADVTSIFRTQPVQAFPASSTIAIGETDIFSGLPDPQVSPFSSTSLQNMVFATSAYNNVLSTNISTNQPPSIPKPNPVLNGPPPTPPATPLQNLGLPTVFANWTGGIHSILAADTSFYTQGSQSLSITTDGAGDPTNAMVFNQGPYNLSNKYLEIWIRVSSTTDVDDLWFVASSDDLHVNSYTWKLNREILSSADESEIQAGEWVPIILTFDSDGNNMVTTGAPDITALNSFELHVSDQKAGPLTVWLGGVSAVTEPSQGALTIVLDNGWISEYTLAMPTLAKYGFPGVIAEIPETANDTDFMSTPQLQYLQNDLGWDIACHTWDHSYQLGLPSTTIPIMDSEFIQCQNWLMQNGLGKASNILVWPNGSNSSAAIAEASKYFVAARGIVGKMFNTLPSANPMLLYATEFGGDTPTSTLDGDVDRCMANHEWCIFYGHIITTSTPIDQDQYASSSFDDFIAHIAADGIPVKTITDVLSNEPSLPAPSETSLQSPVSAASSFLSSISPTTPVSTSTLLLPYIESDFANDMNWEKDWGAMSIDTSNFMDVGANTSTTGGGVLLNGSSAWTDYNFNTTIDWIKGEEFSLIARYNDKNDYVFCEFSNTGEINAYRLQDGQRTLIGQGSVLDFSTNGDITASIKVSGSHVSCGLNSSVVTDYLFAGLPPNLMQGGIGLETWDPQTDNTEIIIKQVSISSL